MGKEDLRSTLRCLTRNELSEEEVEFVVEKVICHYVFDFLNEWFDTDLSFFYVRC